MWPRGPLVSLRALADTCRTQVPGRDGSRSDRTAGASYGAVSREVSDAGTSVLSVPATPLPLEPCSSAPWHRGPQCLPGPQGPAQQWPESREESGHGVPHLLSALGPPPLCTYTFLPLECDRSLAGVSFVPLSSKARRRARGGLKASPWHRAGVGGSRGVPSCPEWVQRLLCCQSQPGCGRGPKQPLGLRLSGGCEAGSGDGWEPPVWWPCGWAGADQVWVSGWSRGPWVPGAPVTGAQSDPGQSLLVASGLTPCAPARHWACPGTQTQRS